MTTTLTSEKAYEMIELAISNSMGIEFDIESGGESLSGSYLPDLFKVGFNPVKAPQAGWYLGISHFYGSKVKIASTPKDNVDFSVPVDLCSEESINRAVSDLMEKEREWFFSRSFSVVTKSAWASGNDWGGLIENVGSFPVHRLISWEDLCRFSQYFTHPEDDVVFKQNYVYMDNSGGFKYRGAWKFEWICEAPTNDGINFVLPHLPSLEDEVIEHSFGEWEAWERPQEDAVFLFESCNGNTLVAFVGNEDGECIVNVFISKEDCNYAKFFAA